MGQYFKVVNLDKRQYLHPHKFHDGLKLMEFGSSSDGTMCALAILLADSNGRGGGDCRSDNPLIGSWAGDHIVITGDYADAGQWSEYFLDIEGATTTELYDLLEEHFEDISEKILDAVHNG